jgi:RecA/RadA recombinase
MSKPATPLAPQPRFLKWPPAPPSQPIVRGEAALPTGSFTLDVVTVDGGWPKGAISEIFGDAGTGKTTVALMAVRQALQRDEGVVWMDADRTLPARLAQQMGVDFAHVAVVQPTSAEEAFQMIHQLLKARAADLIVVDSLPALLPRREMQADLRDAEPATVDHVTKGIGAIMPHLRASRAALLLVNHARPGFKDLEEETSFGGAAVHLRSRLRVRLVQLQLGQQELWVRIVKNQAAPGNAETGQPSQWRIPFVPAQGVNRALELRMWADRTQLPVDELTVERCQAWWRQQTANRIQRKPVQSSASAAAAGNNAPSQVNHSQINPSDGRKQS